MITISQLAQQLLALEPQKNPARLALYHYLKNFLPLDVALTQEMIDAFYDRALTFQYWQQNKNTLGETVKGDLEAIAARNPFGFDVEQILHSSDMQVINLENFRDFSTLLKKELTRFEKAGDFLKTFRLSPENAAQQDILCVRVQKTGGVIVETRTNIAILENGELQLVRPLSRLTYTPDLDFDLKVDQVLTTQLMRVARFETVTAVQDSRSITKVKGSFIQGASFHRTETFERTIEDVPELFQAIKKLERFYINPVTDPYYSQLMENFEQAFNEKEL